MATKTTETKTEGKDSSKGDVHTLQTGWSLWEHRENTDGSWSANFHKVCDFRTVEEFWKYWNHLPKPSQIFYDGERKHRFVDRTVESFSLMKAGIRPEWEDPANSSGAELFCRKTLDVRQLDVLWESMVLGCIGEVIDPNDEVCGCRVVDKSKAGRPPLYRLEVWLRKDNQDIADDVKRCLMNVLMESSGGGMVPSFDWRDHKGY